MPPQIPDACPEFMRHYCSFSPRPNLRKFKTSEVHRSRYHTLDDMSRKESKISVFTRIKIFPPKRSNKLVHVASSSSRTRLAMLYPAKKISKNPPNGERKLQTMTATLTKPQIDEIEAIAQAEGLTKAEVLRKAVDVFLFHYKTDQLDQRQLAIEKRMKEMDRSLRTLLAKSIRVDGQILWFLTAIWTHGLPARKVTPQFFQSMWDSSRQFASQLLKTRNEQMIEEQPLTEERLLKE
jgi:hypothetical protein